METLQAPIQFKAHQTSPHTATIKSISGLTCSKCKSNNLHIYPAIHYNGHGHKHNYIGKIGSYAVCQTCGQLTNLTIEQEASLERFVIKNSQVFGDNAWMVLAAAYEFLNKHGGT